MVQVAVGSRNRQPVLAAELLQHPPRRHILKKVFMLFQYRVFVFVEKALQIQRIVGIINIKDMHYCMLRQTAASLCRPINVCKQMISNSKIILFKK